MTTTAYTQFSRVPISPTPNSADAVPSLLPKNTFPAPAVNLPYEPSDCIIGSLPIMHPKDVRAMIDSAFIKEGLALTKDTLIKEEGLYVVLGGYDATYQIGYVLLDHNNFAEDWRTINSYIPEPESSVFWLKSQAEQVATTEAEKRQIEAAQHELWAM